MAVELGEEQYRHLGEVSAIQLGAPYEDVTAALNHGVDGDRRLLDSPPLAVT